MRKQGRIRIALATVALLGVTSSAMAADKLVMDSLTVKPGKAKVKPITLGQFAEFREKLGACIVQRNRAKVKAYLQHSDSVTVDYKALGTDQMMFGFTYFQMQACQDFNPPQVAQEVFMKPGALRSLLQEATYMDQLKAVPPPAVDDKGEPTPGMVRNFATTTDALQSVKIFAALADCAAAKNPAGADAVVRSHAGLGDEKDAAVALAPTIGSCMPEGQNIKLTQQSIRTLAAEGLWGRYASGPAQASAK
jgi:hypothetical protein